MNYHIILSKTNIIFSNEFSTLKKIMDEYEDHIFNIKMNHATYNVKIRTLKDIISPTTEIIEDKVNEKKIKPFLQRTAKDRRTILARRER